MVFRSAAIVLLFITGLAACASRPVEPVAATGAAPAIPSSPQRVYECSGSLYAVDQLDDAVLFHFPDHARRLPQVESASGARYSDGGVTFWSKGDEALLSYAQEDQQCRLVEDAGPWQRADLRGVEFRGVGQEPGWYVEIAPGRNILFVGDYGEIVVTAPVPPAITEPSRGLTEYYTMSGNTELSVRIQEKPCTDAMNGQEFEATVYVRYGAKEYEGCGRSL